MWSDLLAVLLSLAATASAQSIGQTILNKLATGFKETLQRGKTFSAVVVTTLGC